MNIAYIIPSLANKGPVLVVKDLVEEMVKNGHQCTVFYFDDIREITFICPTHRLRYSEKINFKKFDIIHSHGIRPDSYVFFHKPFKKCKTKFLTTLHNYVIRDLSHQYNRSIACIFGNLWMWLLWRHDKIITLSQDAMQYYRKWFAAKHLAYAYNTRIIPENNILEEKELQQILAFKQESILVGINALLSPIKGVDMLIKALTLLEGYKLLVVGDGKAKESLEKLAEQCEVEDRVLFIGYQKNAYRYLHNYDVYAMPSRSEGFPLALLEAATIPIPVVCSDIPLFREIFPEEVIFFELENISHLAEALKKAVGNKEMASRIHQKYLDIYSPDFFYKRYINIYQSL